MIRSRTLLAAFAALAGLGACTEPGYTRAPAGAPEQARYESPESRPARAHEIREDDFDRDGGMEDNGLLPGDEGYEPAAPYDPSGPDAQPIDWDGTEDDLDRDEDDREDQRKVVRISRD